MNINHEDIKQIEKALGFQLFPWVRQALMSPNNTNNIPFPTGRCIGDTTYNCIMTCLSEKAPMMVISVRTANRAYLQNNSIYASFSDIDTPQRMYIYLSELKRIHNLLLNNTNLKLRDIRFR